MNSLSLKRVTILVAISATLARAFQQTGTPVVQEAQKELFANRFDNAARLYSTILERNPAEAEAHIGLVAALLGAHRSKEAYAAADRATQAVPNTAEALTAAGMAAYRRGELKEADDNFRAALKVNPQYPQALKEISQIYRTVSKFQTARKILLAAYQISPEDTDLMMAYANSLKGPAHVAALERVLAVLDPQAERAEDLRVHIAADRALGERKLRQLVSPYQNSEVKLFKIMDPRARLHGYGLRVQVNGKETVRLLLDTGAAGVAVSPKVAERAGLIRLTDETTKAKGIGDEKPHTAVGYLATELRAGDVVFRDYPIRAFKTAQFGGDFDGLIGADVFGRFLVGMDFVHSELSLQTRANDASSSDEPEDASDNPTAGFFRVLRFGDHFALPTFVNDEKQPRLFLVDSGATMNLIDSTTARDSTGLYNDGRTRVRGVQGKVDETLRASRVTLTFAGFRQENDGLISIDLDKMSEDFGARFGGVLGMPILSQLKLTVDYREGTARMEHQQQK